MTHTLATREQVGSALADRHPNFLFGVLSCIGKVIGTVHLGPNGTYHTVTETGGVKKVYAEPLEDLLEALMMIVEIRHSVAVIRDIVSS